MSNSQKTPESPEGDLNAVHKFVCAQFFLSPFLARHSIAKAGGGQGVEDHSSRNVSFGLAIAALNDFSPTVRAPKTMPSDPAMIKKFALRSIRKTKPLSQSCK